MTHRQTRPEVNTADSDGCDPETKGEPKWPLPTSPEATIVGLRATPRGAEWRAADRWRGVRLWPGAGAPPVLTVWPGHHTVAVQDPTQADVRHAIRWLCGLELTPTTEGSEHTADGRESGE